MSSHALEGVSSFDAKIEYAGKDRAYTVFRRLLAITGMVASVGAFAPAAVSADYDPHDIQSRSPGALGKHKIATILVNFDDDPSQPFTAQQVREAMFTAPDSVNNYFNIVSFGQFGWRGKYTPEGDVYDWIKLPSLLRHSCEKEDLIEVGEAANKAVEKATGRQLDGYDNYLYIFPRRMNCINPNTSQIENGHSIGNTTFINSRRNIIFKGILVHELAHTKGLSHANRMRCLDAKGRRTIPLLGLGRGCNRLPYQDPFDPMGQARISIDQPIDFDALDKARMGWLKPENVKTVTKDTTLEIAPDEAPSNQPQLVRIPYGTAEGERRFVYLDYRQPIGVDAKVMPAEPMINGVTIREAGPIGRRKPITLGDYSYLIDTHPNTPTGRDAPLNAGQTYYDAQTGIKIKTTNTGPTAQISITFAK